MKKFINLSSILSLSFALSAFATKAPRLDLEMTGPEYEKYFKSNKEVGADVSAPINNILFFGKRNLDWFKLINANRPADQQLPLVTPALQTGIPIEKPKAYNETTVLADYETLISQMPEAYKAILLTTVDLPTTHPFETDDAYLEWARKMDKSYQSASRWTTMLPYLDYLASISYQDIRGYYFLSKNPDTETQLNNWNGLSPETQKQLSEWLISLCHNSQLETDACRQKLAVATQDNTIWNFYSTYLPDGKAIYDAFFNIEVKRSDVTWNSSNESLMSVPFTNPHNLEIQNWLADNIQDEFKWNDWKLQLAFTEESSPDTTHIVFEAGSTPHVNDLAGSEITMDDNAPLQDYGTRWTIRHEYGHTLGFPDCYIEFYDVDQKIIINYQLDLDNLMCSRKGHFQQIHFDELKEVYFQN